MIVTVHQYFGFFMNWFGNLKGEGYCAGEWGASAEECFYSEGEDGGKLV